MSTWKFDGVHQGATEDGTESTHHALGQFGPGAPGREPRRRPDDHRLRAAFSAW